NPESSKHQTARPTRKRQEEAFGHQLPDQAPARGPKRRPDHNLVTTRRRAPKQEIGKVGASDQEHEQHRAEKNQQRRPNAAYNTIEQWNEQGVTALILIRILLGQPLVYAAHFSLGLCCRSTRGEAKVSPKEMNAAELRGQRIDDAQRRP